MTLCRISSFDKMVYVLTGYPVFYVSDKGRLVCGLPEDCSQGVKPARLGQFNQHGREFVLLCEAKDLDRHVGFFLRKTRLERIRFRKAEPHPLWRLHQEVAARRARRKK